MNRDAQPGTPAAVVIEMKTKAAIADAIALITEEAVGAMARHAPMSSPHEAYAVIMEEVCEFWDEVMKRKSNREPVPEAMRRELVQIAAMAVRALVDLRPELARGDPLPVSTHAS